jgi:glutathione S-transferase
VPALELDSGDVLTEGPAIVQYLADQKPEAGLAPANGTLARAHLQEMLNYISTELHKTYSPLFNPATSAETREERKEYLRKRFAYVDTVLAKRALPARRPVLRSRRVSLHRDVVGAARRPRLVGLQGFDGFPAACRRAPGRAGSDGRGRAHEAGVLKSLTNGGRYHEHRQRDCPGGPPLL